MHHVERIEQGRGQRRPKNSICSLFKTFENHHPGGEVHPVGGECQRLGGPAAGMGQRHAQRPHLPLRNLGLLQEGGALAFGQVFTRACGGVQRHAGLRRRRFR